MLDPKLLREDPDAFKDAATKKRVASPDLVDQWLIADRLRARTQASADHIRNLQTKVGSLIARSKGAATPELKEAAVELANAAIEFKPLWNAIHPQLPSTLDGLELVAALGRVLKDVKSFNTSLQDVMNDAARDANTIMLQLPAIPDPSWPVGKDDTDNVVVRHWHAPGREPKPLAASQQSHIQLGESLDLIDFDRGVKVAGSRAYVMRGAGALLYNAVLRYALDTLVARGWQPFVVPVLVTEACMTGTGYFPAGRDQAYITQDQTVLTGTSEVALASLLGDEIVDLATLPRRMVAMSTCFRREAGAAGRDTAGLYRVHQFDKVEQVVVHAADEAEHIAIHEEIISNSEHLLQQLGLAYRVVQNCTGDMGQGKWRMYDIETWMPSRNAYGETHSGSALRDFQSRRLNLRYRKPGEKQPTFAYTLNNTAIACPRVLIAILETYQQPDGSITVPDVLRPYMGGVTRIAREQ